MAAPRPNLASRLFGKFLGSAVSNAAGYGVGGAILPTLEPLTRDLANQANALHPSRALSAGPAAEAVLKGYITRDVGETDASYGGYDAARFEAMVELAGSPPTTDELVDLFRRGAISEAQLERGIAQTGLKGEWRDRIKARVNTLASVTDMVRFAVREVYDPGARAALDLDAEFPSAFAAEAKRIGIGPELAGQYWAAHWELPSYTQAAQMLFRGEIDRGRFQALLKALDYAPTWRGPLEAIARAIPPISDMIRFAVREVYDPASRNQLGLDAEYPAVFTAKAAMHGMNEQDARDYWAAHWRLPSAQQGYRMLWRGEITEAQLDGLLKALDYPPRWRGPLANIARLVPGRIDLKRMFRYDILTRAEVVAGYQRLGYTRADAENLTAIAEHEAGVGETASPWLTRAKGRLYTVAHNEYLDQSIDQAKVREMFGLIGVLDREVAPILQLWDAERSVNRLELTPAQVRKAFTSDLYPRETAIAELVERGMTTEDAQTYLDS